jgi:hypothetical protein
MTRAEFVVPHVSRPATFFGHATSLPYVITQASPKPEKVGIIVCFQPLLEVFSCVCDCRLHLSYRAFLESV